MKRSLLLSPTDEHKRNAKNGCGTGLDMPGTSRRLSTQLGELPITDPKGIMPK